jgi:hypothetical protein
VTAARGLPVSGAVRSRPAVHEGPLQSPCACAQGSRGSLPVGIGLIVCGLIVCEDETVMLQRGLGGEIA